MPGSANVVVKRSVLRCVVKDLSPTGNNSWLIWTRWGTEVSPPFNLCWLSSWSIWLLKMALNHFSMSHPWRCSCTLTCYLTWSYLKCWESLLILCTVLWLPFIKCVGLHITVEIVRTPSGLSSMLPAILAHHRTRLHCFCLSTNKCTYNMWYSSHFTLTCFSITMPSCQV